MQEKRTRSSLSAPNSLYQQSMIIIQKLYSLPDFEFYLFPQGLDEVVNQAKLKGLPPITSPTDILWSCFRLGAPLCHLFNQLQPLTILAVPDVSGLNGYTNVCKKCIFHFLQGCKVEKIVPEAELFSISELYKDDINGLVKVLHVVSALIERLEYLKLFPPEKPLPFALGLSTETPADNRGKILNEIVESERKYLAALEEMEAYQEELTLANTISKDTIYEIFANLSELLDFQRRFLLAMEATLSLGPAEQRIGLIFSQNEAGFVVYEPMCGNYAAAIQVALKYQDFLEAVQPKVKARTMSSIDPGKGLQNVLIQPVQRICRYPLLLKELIKFSEIEEYQYMDELNEALEVIKRVTDRVNESQRLAENRAAKAELFEKMEDWKDFNPSSLGPLLLKDKFLMMVGENEREYYIYLFDRVLLCCKELPSSKKKGDTVFVVKGNIYMTSVLEIRDLSQPNEGIFELKIYWKDTGDMQTFNLKCRNEEQAKLWKERFEQCHQASRSYRPMSYDEKDSRTLVDMDNERFARSLSVNAASQRTEYNSQVRKSGGIRSPEVATRSSSMFSNQQTGISAFSPVSPYIREYGPFTNGYISTRRPSTSSEPTPPIPPPERQRSSSSNQQPASQSQMHRDRTISAGPPQMLLPPTPRESSKKPPNLALPATPGTVPKVPPSIPLPKTPIPVGGIPFSGPPPIPLPKAPAVSALANTDAAPLAESSKAEEPLPRRGSSSRTTIPRHASQLLKLKTHYGADIFILAVPSKDCKYQEVLEKIERKIRICGSQLPEGRRIKLKYKDEDGDFITVNTDEDLELAFEAVRNQTERGAVNIYAE